MRKVKRWRYYCDYCKKSGASGGHMAKHERHCLRRPDRECRMCKAAGDVTQKDMPTLRAALDAGGLEELTRVAEHCPACILATLMQDRMENPPVFESDTGYSSFIEFDYKAASADWFRMIDIRREQEGECLY